MDSESLSQIKRVAKEAAEEAVESAIDHKLRDMLEYKIGPLADKLTDIHNRCMTLLDNISDLKHHEITEIREDLQRTKRLIRSMEAKPKNDNALAEPMSDEKIDRDAA